MMEKKINLATLQVMIDMIEHRINHRDCNMTRILKCLDNPGYRISKLQFIANNWPCAE